MCKPTPASWLNFRLYLLAVININNQAAFGVAKTDDGSWLASIYVSTESWTWVSFIKLAYLYIVIGFQDSTYSYIKVYYYGGKFASYQLTSSIKLYAFAKNKVYSYV